MNTELNNKTTYKKYNLNEIPDRDKLILRPYQDQYEFMNGLPELIRNNQDKYNAYFMNYTFRDPEHERSFDSYREYFQLMRQRLDNALLCNSSSYSKKPYLLMIPEEDPYLHFHGFLLIHKDNDEKFKRKCVIKIKSEFIEKMTIFKDSYRLQEKIINPYSKKRLLNSNDRRILEVADYRIYPVNDPHEFFATMLYSNKKSIKSRFSYDDNILESKPSIH